MGAVPSRECTSLFSYFRGSYEVGMVPLTKYYFGKDTDATTAPVDVDVSVHIAPLQRAITAGRKPQQQPPSLLLHAGSRSHMRQQLRQQLLLMRRDPAVLYANARDAQNILQSLSRQENSTHHKSSGSSETRATSAETASLSSTARVAKDASTSAATGVAAAADHNVNENSGAATPEKSRTDSLTGASDSERSGSNPPVHQQDGSSANDSCATERLFRNYWSIMPDNNFTEADLDRFLDLVDATLFDTNDELISADPIFSGTAATPGTSSTKSFMPVPCALCLAYPDGKEREGALALDGRVINIIGYFGLMTREMQDAFKVVKRFPNELEKQRQHADEADSASGSIMFLNTAILTSAGDRTLERVLVLAAVMLRQQFHTIGRRHALQAKLSQLLQEQSEHKHNVDPQMVRYLQKLLALPPRAEQQQPFFDPLLEVPLPSIPSGIYTPTQYVNAASNEASQRPHASSLSSCGRPALGNFPGGGKFQNSTMGLCNGVAGESSSPHLRSLPNDRPSSMGGTHSASGAGSGHVLLYPQQSASGVPAGGVLGVSHNSLGPGSGSEGTCPPLMDGCGESLGANAAMSSPPVLGPLPLSQSDEDAITLALCRRMQQGRVVIETASNNYSALKSLTENFAFLCCQILLDPSLITMELVELPALVETPSFKPAESAKTVATTLSSTASEEARSSTGIPHPTADDEKPVSTARPSQPQLPPSSAVLIKLDPQHVCQATMWASSFFHCPTLLPSGAWVKYKLKDECEQLRHVLQNKDMLIAHWRKTDVDQAGQYLGKHTARLLEHVRALQAETEEARALSAEYWMQRPLYVNQDGRKYGLYQSRYGTMLIGVRAFTAGNGSSAAAANAKEERSGSTKAAVGNNATSFSCGSTSLAAHAGQASTISSSLHSANSGSGSGLAIASRGAAPRSGGANGSRMGHHSVFSSNNDVGMGLQNVSGNGNISERYGRGVGGDMAGGGAGYSNNGPYVNYPPHTANGNSGNGTYAPTPFMQPQVYMGNSNSGRPGEAVPYCGSPSVPGYLMEMASGYNTLPPQQQQRINIMNTVPDPHKSKSDHSSGHSRVGSSLAHGVVVWPAMQPSNAQMPPPPASSHMNCALPGQQQGEVMGSPSGFAYAAATSSMSYKPAPPTYHAASHNVNPPAAGTCALASSPQSSPMSGEQVSNSPLRADVAALPQLRLQSPGNSDAQHGLIMDAAKSAAASRPLPDAKAPWANGKNGEVPRSSEPAKSATSSTTHGNGATATLAAAAPFPHGCVGTNRGDVGAAGNCFAASQCNGSATQQAARSSSDPHSTKAPDESKATDQVTAPKAAVLRSVMPWSLQGGTGWESNDDARDDTTQFLLRSTELLDVGDDDATEEPAGGNSNNAPSGGTASNVEELGAHRVARLVAGRDMFVANAAHQLPQPTPTKNIDMSIMNMLLAAAPQPQPSDAAMSSTAAARQLTFPTVAEPPKPVPAPSFQPGGVFPVYVLQLPAHPPQPQPQLTTTSPLPAAAPPSDKPLYYTMANGVPLLVQPSTTPGGLAVTYPNGQPFPHGGDGFMPYPAMPQPPPPQQLQQQPIPMMPHGQAMMSTAGLDGRPVARLSVQPSASWGSQYRFFPSSPGNLAGAFANSRAPAYSNNNGNNPFQAGNDFS
ncbi:conserved hypothetical protein [Leishmania mexicana MHOM/GT/2001/U1103]|uniref:Uncharacterized protein n=1 Tax=Leishmania mexicana (strain MHOM/GT/2001/U1103) TaxID=929439 RepID=E9AUL4_LEIMU|nr:conserved hypothetical protein [Leishmania mexicana MHOM/GT/2001/U1103]CBZ26643.1 conserved hypothetical protein [Leishmania mexicana MHOM/GT/2001/U1103]